METDVELYAPTNTGRVTASNGLTYTISNGKVRVPRSVASGLVASGYIYEPPSEVDIAGASAGEVNSAFVVVSASAPSNADGRPDGTVYIQSAS